METVYIVLIVVAAIVVLAVAWMYRNRLTEGSFEGGNSRFVAAISKSRTLCYVKRPARLRNRGYCGATRRMMLPAIPVL